MEHKLTKHLVRFDISYSIYIDAVSENDAIEKANETPLEKWDKSESQFEAEECA